MEMQRRNVMSLLAAGIATQAFAGPTRLFNPQQPSFIEMCRHPLLIKTVYSRSPGGQIADDGSAGRNQGGLWMIEEQRVGGDYVLRGALTNHPDWCQIGWRILDWGMKQQQSDGSFKCAGARYHSTSLFLLSFANACLADPAGATDQRLDCLRKGAAWMVSAVDEGHQLNSGYTHRNYLCAATLGQIAAITSNDGLLPTAYDWAHRGLAAQLPNGVNPEHGGFDVSYQMVGPSCAIIFMPACTDAKLVEDMKGMTRRAIAWWLARQLPNGSVEAEGSTRVFREQNTNGTPKQINYRDAIQTLVWGAQALPDASLIAPTSSGRA